MPKQSLDQAINAIADLIAAPVIAQVQQRVRERVRAAIRESLGGAEAAQVEERPRRAPRKGPKRVAKAKAQKAAPVRRKRTSAAEIAGHLQLVRGACRVAGADGAWFKRADVQSRVGDGDVDVGRMLSLLTGKRELVKRGDRRATEYRLSVKAFKANGAPDRVVERDEEQSVGGAG